MLWILRPRFLVPILFAGWFIFMWYELLHPKADHPQKADVVMVLSGDERYRLPTAVGLMDRGVARTLIISDGQSAENATPRSRALCNPRITHPFQVICARPKPYSTRGEAEMFARLAATNHWRSVAIVSSPTHLTRLRILFKRCYKGKIYAVRSAQTALSKLESVFFETGKLIVETTIVRGC